MLHEHPLIQAMRLGDAQDLRPVVHQHPDWPVSTDPNECPLSRLLTLYCWDQDRQTRHELLQVLLEPLAPKALYHRPAPLVTVAENNWADLIPMLLPYCDPNAVHEGQTPLGAAAYEDQRQALAALLPVSNLNAINGAGETALMRVAKVNMVSSLKTLIEQPGLLIDQPDPDGRTALIHAARSGHWDATRHLLNRGANPNAQDRQGRTALMHAVAEGWESLAGQMLNHKPVFVGQLRQDLTLHDHDGHSAESLAAAGGMVVTEALRLARQRQEETALRRTLGEAVHPSPSGPKRSGPASRTGRSRSRL